MLAVLVALGSGTEATASETGPKGYRCVSTGMLCRKAPCFSFVCTRPNGQSCRGAHLFGRWMLNCPQRRS